MNLTFENALAAGGTQMSNSLNEQLSRQCFRFTQARQSPDTTLGVFFDVPPHEGLSAAAIAGVARQLAKTP
jgi:hypothetical protein